MGGKVLDTLYQGTPEKQISIFIRSETFSKYAV